MKGGMARKDKKVCAVRTGGISFGGEEAREVKYSAEERDEKLAYWRQVPIRVGAARPGAARSVLAVNAQGSPRGVRAGARQGADLQREDRG